MFEFGGFNPCSRLKILTSARVWRLNKGKSEGQRCLKITLDERKESKAQHKKSYFDGIDLRK